MTHAPNRTVETDARKSGERGSLYLMESDPIYAALLSTNKLSLIATNQVMFHQLHFQNFYRYYRSTTEFQFAS